MTARRSARSRLSARPGSSSAQVPEAQGLCGSPRMSRREIVQADERRLASRQRRDTRSLSSRTLPGHW